MTTIEIRSQVSLNDFLNGVAQLNSSDLEQFVSQVLALRAKRVAPSISKGAKILEKINSGISSGNAAEIQ